MKKLLLLSMILCFVFAGFSQRATPSKQMRDYAVKKVHPSQHSSMVTQLPVLPSYKADLIPEEEVIGQTRYDLQTNTSCQNRFHVYDDGTMGAVWTLGFDDPGFANDRGTGYNYFDGSEWGEQPLERIENIRTGWPSYAPYGENGELVVSHDFGAGSLLYLMRDEKGTGDWMEMALEGPSVPISWNRSTTSGVNHNIIQTLAITWPVANGGSVYQGLDGALLYSRSADGGTTWEPENVILEGLTSNEYFGFSADMYEWATQGDNIAFLVGDSWQDFVLMKSNDNGDNWTKTVIWEHPYPLWNATETDTFYCVDGAHHLAFDSDGMVHVVFGINRAVADATGAAFWFPGVGGIGYWNEDMPSFSNDLDALCPFSDCTYSELVEDVTLIGWTQDVNNNGTLDVLDDWGTYYIGFSSQPQITIDENDGIYVVFSSVTETYDNGTQNYRHLWARASWDVGYWGDFVDLSSDLIHIFDECVFPSLASKSDDAYYMVYQADTEPGLAVRGDEDPYGDNFIHFLMDYKDEIMPGIKEESQVIYDYDVLQNSPNPFTNSSVVGVNIRKACNLSLTITNLTGQKLLEINKGDVFAGMNKIEIDGRNMSPGIYFYTVNAGNSSITKKMIVE